MPYPKTDWNELRNGYNRIYGVKCQDIRAMLKDAYQRFGNVKAMAKALGVYYLTACQKMDEYGLERKPIQRIDWQAKLDTFNKTHGTDYDEAEIIRTVYKSMGGIHKTAAYFDVTYTAMRNKLKEHHIDLNPRGGNNRSKKKGGYDNARKRIKDSKL